MTVVFPVCSFIVILAWQLGGTTPVSVPAIKKFIIITRKLRARSLHDFTSPIQANISNFCI